MTETRTWLGVRLREWVALAVAVPIVIGVIIAAKPLVSSILDHILHLNPTLVYVVVFALVFSEAAIFFGFIFPGETAVILGGVVASTGSVNVILLGFLVVVGAILGDSVGYFIGSRYGERVLKFRLLENRKGGIESGLALLRRRGAMAVFIGRFTAFLRAVMPGLAGLSKMHYRTFLKANASGGIVWGISFTALGYFLGGAYTKAEKYAGWVSTGLLIVILLLAVSLFIRGRIKERRVEATAGADPLAADRAIHEEIEAAREHFEHGDS
jgi:membrane protein DedA with SNARE-associated domain